MIKGKAVSTDEDREIDRAVGVRIRSLRLLSGRSQVDIARAVGVTFQQMQKYERGDNRVAASRLVAIARAFDVPASHLLGEGGGEPPPVLDLEVRRFLEDYRACSASARRAVAQVVEVLARRS